MLCRGARLAYPRAPRAPGRLRAPGVPAPRDPRDLRPGVATSVAAWSGTIRVMLYRVHGANSVSGEDERITLKAESEDQAAHAARVAGLLVERVELIEEDALQTLSVAVRAAPGATPVVPAYRGTARDAEGYPDIARGARVLRILASILSWMGWLTITYVVVMQAWGLFGGTPTFSVRTLLGIILFAAVPMTVGIGLLVVAALLRFIAAIGLAIRDVAQRQ